MKQFVPAPRSLVGYRSNRVRCRWPPRTSRLRISPFRKTGQSAAFCLRNLSTTCSRASQIRFDLILAEKVAIHAQCHAKSLLNPNFMARLVERLLDRKATVLDTGCCGMAGAFGALAEKYDLSVQVAAHLIEKLHQEPPGTTFVAPGTSCRHQIVDFTTARPKHMAELLAEAITN